MTFLFRNCINMISKALILILLLACAKICTGYGNTEDDIKKFFERGNHTDIWAVLVDSHPPQHYEETGAGAVRTIYWMLKKFGVPDSQIILMAGNPAACTPVNPQPGKIFAEVHGIIEVNENVEVDYKGDDVTVRNVLRVLTDRHPPGTLRSRRLLSTSKSNVLIMFSAHGGSTGFVSFRDQGSLYSLQLTQAIKEMRQQDRYNEILVISVTCHAGALCTHMKGIENVLCFGSSKPNELTITGGGTSIWQSMEIKWSAYAFIRLLARYLDDMVSGKMNYSLQDFVSTCTRENCDRDMYAHRDFYPKPLDNVSLDNFFNPQPLIEYLPVIEFPESDFD